MGCEKAPPGRSHHWIISAQNGPISEGVCKFCREKREFKNSLPEPNWLDLDPIARKEKKFEEELEKRFPVRDITYF